MTIYSQDIDMPQTHMEAWWDAFDGLASAQYQAQATAYYELGLEPRDAANWANDGFTADQAKAWMDAGFAPGEAHLTSWYRDICDTPEQGYMERLVDDTNEMVERADHVEEMADEKMDIATSGLEFTDDGRLVPIEYDGYEDGLDGGQADLDDDGVDRSGYVDHTDYSGYEPIDVDAAKARMDAAFGVEPRGTLEYTGDLAEAQAGLAESSLPRPPERPALSPEAEQIAQGVEAREAEMDAIEADADMVGSEAWTARQWDEMGEYVPDGEGAGNWAAPDAATYTAGAAPFQDDTGTDDYDDDCDGF